MLKKRLSALLLSICCLGLTTGLLGCGASEKETISDSADTKDTVDSAEQPSLPDEETPAAPEEIRIGGLKGPTSMGMIQIMENAEAGTASQNYTFTIAASADELTPAFLKGELDMIAVPANLASVLYNKTDGNIRLAAINTLGVLYIVEKGDSISSLADLKGQTIYATGKGTTPEYALRYLLTQNGLNPDTDVTIEWKNEATEVVGVLSNAETGIAMLPQPFVTVAMNTVEGLRIAVNMTEAWNALENGSQLLTGVLIVRSAFADAYPDAMKAFLQEYEASTKFVNENTEEAAALIEKFGIVKAAIAKTAIPYCNITCIQGADMQPLMEGYLNTLLEQNPKSIGEKLPGTEYYYVP